MEKIKKFHDWLNENGNAQMGITSIDNPGGFTYNPLGEEEDESNYMFFSNIRRIHELSEMLLKLDHQKMDDMLNNGHDWANDHITKAKENLSQVFEFFNDNKSVTESAVSDLNRQYSMGNTWWAAWRLENEKKQKLKITKDLFSKTYEVKKGDKVLLIYDYSKSKIYTNESPETFILKNDIDNEEMSKIRKKVDDIKDDLSGADSKDKKEEEASGELETDKTEEE